MSDQEPDVIVSGQRRLEAPVSQDQALSADRGDARELLAAVRSGNPRALGRLISWIENASPTLPMIMKELAPDTGRAHIVGLTGAPGVGKSTTVTSLIRALRARGERVGVLAVDPSSPFSGGALLGDRVRMQEHALDRDVYIRSMASRGHLGGLAVATPQALRAFDAANFDTVIVETVGVGQSELEVAETADTILVLLAPGMGDGIQTAKAGILEIGDIFVVNKSDREGAQALVRELRTMIALASREPDDWKPPIVTTVAYQHRGIDDLLPRSIGFGYSRWSLDVPRYDALLELGAKSKASLWRGCARSFESTARRPSMILQRR